MTALRPVHASRRPALVLLVLALLLFAARGALHDHDAQPLPGEGLCAICVYGGSSPGAVANLQPPQVVRFRHLPPYSSAYRSVTAPARAITRIRGPPSLV